MNAVTAGCDNDVIVTYFLNFFLTMFLQTVIKVVY